MKKVLFVLVFAVVTLYGCNKEDLTVKDDLNADNPELKMANVSIPMKADFCMTPDMEGGFILIQGLDPTDMNSYLPKHGWISGHATHMGKINMEESPTTFVSAELTPMGVKTVSEGRITAANGDYYLFTSTSYSNPMDQTFTGTVWMYGGVGRFEGMTGTVTMTGAEMCWTAEGTMQYN